MVILKSQRLRFRPFTLADAPFMLKLLNEPAYHQNIGDRGVRTLEQCEQYLQNKIISHYDDRGLGMFIAEALQSGEVLGFAGLIKRDVLEVVDVGYAFSPAHWGQGYATEAAQAMLEYARDRLGLKRLGGVVDPRNIPSVRVLEKIGMKFERNIRLTPDDIECQLFTRDLSGSES